MAKAKRICKVCGKEYEYCKTWASANKFRYQDVSCSPECGAKYFAMIEASRSDKKPASKPVSKPVSVVTDNTESANKTPVKGTYRKPKTKTSDKSSKYTVDLLVD